MSKDNKEMKHRRDKSREAHAAMPAKPGVTKPTFSKFGTRRTQSEAVESWDKTSERAQQTRRNHQLKVTLPKLPWDEEK
jgi:hypothetical protein